MDEPIVADEILKQLLSDQTKAATVEEISLEISRSPAEITSTLADIASYNSRWIHYGKTFDPLEPVSIDSKAIWDVEYFLQSGGFQYLEQLKNQRLEKEFNPFSAEFDDKLHLRPHKSVFSSRKTMKALLTVAAILLVCALILLYLKK